MTQQGHLEKVLRHAEKRLVLKSGARPAEILNTYKKFLKVEEHRLRLLHHAGGDGREIAQGRAQVMDVVLRHVLKAADENYRQTHDGEVVTVSLVAIGGYGRGELSPYSDIDIMFLHGTPGRGTSHHPYLKEMVEQVLYMLWDVGLKVGHSTRSIAEATAQANMDMQSKTSMIESRLLTGDEKIYESFRNALVKECVKGHEDEYIAARMEDQKVRHEKFGDSVYLQEPNVKGGCGGLRDFQNLIWMSFFKYGCRRLSELRQRGFLEASEQRQLDAAYDFILRVRNSMHYMTNRACDVIGLGLQPQIASEFGYRQHDLLRRTEAFMRDYYMHSRNIFLLTNALADRMALKPSKPSRLGTLLGRRPRKAEAIDGFLIRDGLISASEPTIFKQDPLRLMRVFRYVQQREVELSPELRSQIRQNLKWVDRSFQRSPEARDTFLGIMQHKGQVARILRRMHEVEFLGRYIPEFGRLTCLVQHEFFHRYTADEHTLQVIEHLDRIIDATEPPHTNYKRIFQQLEHPHVLYLALLLHDVGKAANVDHHAEASLEMSRKVADRLRLGDDETAQLLFLVRDHLKLSMLSQRRDLDDQATIDAAARIVKTEVSLNQLLLLTFADAAGTSLKTWTDWKEALLWELYHRTRQTLTGAERARDILSRRIEQLYKEVSAKLKSQLPLEEIYSHFELMPASYYINTSADDIERHLMVIHRFLTRQLEVEEAADALVPVVDWQSFPAQSYSQVSICTWDRLGLFSKICGALASAELNILRASVYTRGDHVVLDVFDVCDKELAAVTDQRAIQTAEGMLERMLSNRENIEFPEVLKRLRAIRGETPRIREVRIPTIIDIDNEISKVRTIVEVQTEDRLGLLFTITHTLSELNLDISFAKISTEKGAAIDVFYVQDQLGKKITDEARLDGIRGKLETAINLLAS
ncbi:MAG TPA: [protein-PII] uridylyltransferase [Verrucomicrobiae bacterium]|nr:[protein-PII] uridylyltransferase [Verrucomicrobiae bacterium]